MAFIDLNVVERFNDTRVMARFLKKVIPEPNSGCWLWIGSCNDDGYATFGVDGVVVSGHVFIYTAAHGRVTKGRELDHLCRVRCCVNLLHLEAVTKSVNQKRGLAATSYGAALRIAAKRRRASTRTHCKYGHEFTVDNTIYRGFSKTCRRCLAVKCKRYRERMAQKEIHA